MVFSEIMEPFGCGVCGVPAYRHWGRFHHGGNGAGVWVRPTDDQILSRMLTRRTSPEYASYRWWWRWGRTYD